MVNKPLDAQVQQSSEVQITKNYSYVFLWDGKQCTVNGITFVAARTIITWALSELKMQTESPDSFYFCVAGSNDRWTGNKIVPWEGFGGAQLLLHRTLPAAGGFMMESFTASAFSPAPFFSCCNSRCHSAGDVQCYCFV